LDFPSGDNPDDEVTTQTMVPSSTIIKRYKSEEGGDGIWYQLTSKPATASAIDYSTDYYNQLCQEEFGSGSWIVDWSNDLKFLHKRNEIGTLLTALGIDDPTFNESCFFVTEKGADFYGNNRKYFFENHGGNPPNNWLVHDQLGDISLGSWYGIEGKVLCKYSNITTNSSTATRDTTTTTFTSLAAIDDDVTNEEFGIAVENTIRAVLGFSSLRRRHRHRLLAPRTINDDSSAGSMLEVTTVVTTDQNCNNILQDTAQAGDIETTNKRCVSCVTTLTASSPIKANNIDVTASETKN